MAIDDKEMNRRLLRLAGNPEAGFWRFDYNALSRPERVFRAIWELEAQVCNGGFHQYLANPTGALAHDAVDALRVVGANDIAEIAQHAINIVGRDIAWHDHRARRTHVHALTPEALKELDTCDERFFARPDNLTAMLYRYMSEHRKDVRGGAQALEGNGQ